MCSSIARRTPCGASLQDQRLPDTAHRAVDVHKTATAAARGAAALDHQPLAVVAEKRDRIADGDRRRSGALLEDAKPFPRSGTKIVGKRSVGLRRPVYFVVLLPDEDVIAALQRATVHVDDAVLHGPAARSGCRPIENGSYKRRDVD